MKLYHCTTPKKLQRYKESKRICKPVRGFTTEKAALAWCVKTHRTLILAIETDDSYTHKLPDHHNQYGEAWWSDKDVSDWQCIFSVDKV